MNVTLVIGLVIVVVMLAFAFLIFSTNNDEKVSRSGNALNLNLGENDRIEVSPGRNGAINFTVIPVHEGMDGVPIPDPVEEDMVVTSGLNREFWEKVLSRDALSAAEVTEVNETLAKHGLSTDPYGPVDPAMVGPAFDPATDEDIRRGGVPEVIE